MTDWDALPHGYDFSHHNGRIDWNKIAGQKPAFVGLKATQRMWVDPEFQNNKRGAAANGIRWFPYVWVMPDDTQETVRFLRKTVSDDDVPIAIDWEQDGVPSSVVEMWINNLPRKPLVYYGFYPPGRITELIASCPRWYPQYPGRPDAPPRLNPWDGHSVDLWGDQWLIWQWSDNGRVAGTSPEPDDMDRLACSEETFDKWYRTGTFDVVEIPKVPPIKISRILRRNSSGSDVRELQLLLHIQSDGIFGPATERAVKKFQSAHGLKADGIVGPITQAKLGEI